MKSNEEIGIRQLKNLPHTLAIELGGGRDSNSDPFIVNREGLVSYIKTTSGRLIDRAEIELILQKGYDPEYPPVVAEVNYWCRGEERVLRKRKNERPVHLAIDFSPLSFLVDLGFSEMEAHAEIADPSVRIMMSEAMQEARVWTRSVSSLHGTLMYLTVKHMARVNNPKQTEYFLLIIESIINNRLKKVSQLEAFLTVTRRICDGSLTWEDIGGDRVAQSHEIVPHNFARKQEVMRIYTAVMKMIKTWEAEEPGNEMALATVGRRKQQEMMAQILANNYTGELHGEVRLLARAIKAGVVNTAEHLSEAVQYLLSISSQRTVGVEELAKVLKS